MHRRGGETATFDFRDTSSASESSIFSTVSWYRLEYAFESVKDCFIRCCCTRRRHNSTDSETDDDNEDGNDDDGGDDNDAEDKKPLFHKASISLNTLKRKNKKTKKKEYKRKISYYGTVHRNLAQQTNPIADD